MSLSIYTHLMCGYLKTFNATGVHGVFLVLLSMAMHIFSCVPELLPVRVESTLARGSPEKNGGENNWRAPRRRWLAQHLQCVQIMYLFFNPQLFFLHTSILRVFLYSHICCLIHTCIFYLYTSVDYLQGRSALVPGETPVSPFFETSDVCVHFFVPFSAPSFKPRGARPALCLSTHNAIYKLLSIFLLYLQLYHQCYCSCFVTKWCKLFPIYQWLLQSFLDGYLFIT